MKKAPSPKVVASTLRLRAEQRLSGAKTEGAVVPADALKLLQELQVHQVELEMQNEELRQAKADAEVATERYTRLYSELYDFAPVAYFSLERDGTIRKSNLTGAALLGVERSRLNGCRFDTYLGDKERPKLAVMLEKTFAGDGIQTGVLTLTTVTDGTTYVHAKCNFDAAERCCTLMMADVSECKELELSARNSEQRYRTLAAATFEGVAVTSGGRFVDVNDQLLAMLRFSRQEMIGQEISRFIHPEDRDRVMENIRRGRESRVEHRFLRKDGSWIIVEAHGQTIEQRGTQIRLTAIRDITEHRRHEESLRKYAERLQSHIENSPMAVVGWDHAFNVTQWSGTAEKMFGWRAEETVGKPIMDLHMIHEEDIPLVQETMAKLLDGTSRYVISANRNVTKDGRVIHCEWYNSVLTDEQGQMESVMSQVLDVTERKHIEQELVEGNSRLSKEVELRTADLSALAAHIQDVAETERANLARELHDELGSTLVGMSMELGQLRKKLPDAEQLRHADQLKALLTQAVRSKRNVVNRLHPTVLDNAGLYAAIEVLAKEFGMHTGVHVALAMPADPVEVAPAISLAAYRIVQECLTNIAKHAGADRIEVDVRCLADRLEVTMRDNGRGLPADIRTGGHGIFGMLERAHHLGGSMDLASESGNGTSVKLVLPLNIAQQPEELARTGD
jgi:PAS domain S-box-containing protein